MIPSKVVARIAARAAREALARYQGTPADRPGPAVPDASASVHAGTVRLTVSLDLPYPVDIAGTCRQVQDHITERVHRLTGLRIDEVAIVIRRLLAEGTGTGRVR
ncbi:Asp23/Gls24 family envelope stress response protein [Streptomyces sp. NPDC055722]